MVSESPQRLGEREGEQLGSGEVEQLMVGQQNSERSRRCRALPAMRCLDFRGQCDSLFLFVFPTDQVMSEIGLGVYRLSSAGIPLGCIRRKIGAVVGTGLFPLID